MTFLMPCGSPVWIAVRSVLSAPRGVLVLIGTTGALAGADVAPMPAVAGGCVGGIGFGCVEGCGPGCALGCAPNCATDKPPRITPAAINVRNVPLRITTLLFFFMDASFSAKRT